MTLSQIIVKNPFWDRRIQLEGRWNVKITILNGSIDLLKIQEVIHKNDQKK